MVSSMLNIEATHGTAPSMEALVNIRAATKTWHYKRLIITRDLHVTKRTRVRLNIPTTVWIFHAWNRPKVYNAIHFEIFVRVRIRINSHFKSFSEHDSLKI